MEIWRCRAVRRGSFGGFLSFNLSSSWISLIYPNGLKEGPNQLTIRKCSPPPTPHTSPSTPQGRMIRSPYHDEAASEATRFYAFKNHDPSSSGRTWPLAHNESVWDWKNTNTSDSERYAEEDLEVRHKKSHDEQVWNWNTSDSKRFAKEDLEVQSKKSHIENSWADQEDDCVTPRDLSCVRDASRRAQSSHNNIAN